MHARPWNQFYSGLAVDVSGDVDGDVYASGHQEGVRRA